MLNAPKLLLVDAEVVAAAGAAHPHERLNALPPAAAVRLLHLGPEEPHSAAGVRDQIERRSVAGLPPLEPRAAPRSIRAVPDAHLAQRLGPLADVCDLRHPWTACSTARAISCGRCGASSALRGSLHRLVRGSLLAGSFGGSFGGSFLRSRRR